MTTTKTVAECELEIESLKETIAEELACTLKQFDLLGMDKERLENMRPGQCAADLMVELIKQTQAHNVTLREALDKLCKARSNNYLGSKTQKLVATALATTNYADKVLVDKSMLDDARKFVHNIIDLVAKSPFSVEYPDSPRKPIKRTPLKESE